MARIKWSQYQNKKELIEVTKYKANKIRKIFGNDSNMQIKNQKIKKEVVLFAITILFQLKSYLANLWIYLAITA